MQRASDAGTSEGFPGEEALRFGRGASDLAVVRREVPPGLEPEHARRARARLAEEARLLERLAHPGMPRVLSIDLGAVDSDGAVPTVRPVRPPAAAAAASTAEQRPAVVLQVLAGASLADVLAAVHGDQARGGMGRAGGERWSVAGALKVVVRLVETVAYAHANGVVHRGLEPRRVVVGHYGAVQVVDWSLARDLARPDRHDLVLAREGGGRTRDGDALPDVAYVAPELARGEQYDVGPRADVYALGAILLQLFTGRPPAPARAPVRLDRAARLRLHARAPRALARVVQRALAPQRSRRHADARALLAELEAALALGATRTGPVVGLARWAGEHRAAAALLVVAGAALAARPGRDDGVDASGRGLFAEDAEVAAVGNDATDAPAATPSALGGESRPRTDEAGPFPARPAERALEAAAHAPVEDAVVGAAAPPSAVAAVREPGASAESDDDGEQASAPPAAPVAKARAVETSTSADDGVAARASKGRASTGRASTALDEPLEREHPASSGASAAGRTARARTTPAALAAAASRWSAAVAARLGAKPSPVEVATLRAEAAAAREAGAWAEAAAHADALYRRLLTRHGENDEATLTARHELATALGQAGDTEAALIHYHGCLVLRAADDPRRITLEEELGLLLLADGERAEGEARLEAALALAAHLDGPGAPSVTRLCDQLASSAFRAGDLDGVAAALERGLAARRAALPSDAEIPVEEVAQRTSLVQVYQRLGRDEDALRHARALLAATPEDHPARRARAALVASLEGEREDG